MPMTSPGGNYCKDASLLSQPSTPLLTHIHTHECFPYPHVTHTPLPSFLYQPLPSIGVIPHRRSAHRSVLMRMSSHRFSSPGNVWSVRTGRRHRAVLLVRPHGEGKSLGLFCALVRACERVNGDLGVRQEIMKSISL
jgi:hypothetical protein